MFSRGSKTRAGLRPATKRSSSFFVSTHDQRYILTAEPEAVAQYMIDHLLSGLVRHIIEIALRIGRLIVHRRRNDAALDRHDRGDQLDRAGGGDQMAQHALAAGNRY